MQQGVEAHSGVGRSARFSMQLIALSAPPTLMCAAATAIDAEMRHAEACFRLAQRYGSDESAPGALELDWMGLDGDLASVALQAVNDGCIAHALDAMAAREALEHCREPATRDVLMRRHQSKAREAQLAWRFLAWALRGANRELMDAVRVKFLGTLGTSAPPESPSRRDLQLLRHGLIGPGPRRLLRQRVLRDVVLPLMDALLPAPAFRSDGRYRA